MNERPSLAEAATEELKAAPVNPNPATADVRARTIAAMTEALLRQRRAHRRARVATGFAAAAVVLVGVFVGRRLLSTQPGATPSAGPGPLAAASAPTASVASIGGAVVVTSAGQPDRPLSVGATWSLGDRLVAGPDAHALVMLSTGTHVDLFGRADLGLTSLGARQLFDLRAGSARFDVAKLHDGERFLVDTPDAEIEVRGTSFTLSIVPPDPACGGGSPTRLTVREGVVWVRSGATEVRVTAGESWPCGATNALPSPSGSSASVGPAPSSSVKPAAPPPTNVAASATVAASDLAAQNELFARAMAEKKQGNPAGALADLQLFLARYPNSTLRENVEVERMRLLGGAAAVAAAKEYLAHHPSGFAREEAEAIARGATP